MQGMTILKKMKVIFEITFVFAFTHEKIKATLEKNDHYKHFFYGVHFFMMVYDKIFVAV